MNLPVDPIPPGSCPNRACKGHHRHPEFSPESRRWVRKGSYTRSSDHRTLQRYQCGFCRRGFSEATLSLCYRQKKRQVNGVIFRLLTAGVSERETSRLLKIRWETVSK